MHNEYRIFLTKYLMTLSLFGASEETFKMFLERTGIQTIRKDEEPRMIIYGTQVEYMFSQYPRNQLEFKKLGTSLVLFLLDK